MKDRRGVPITPFRTPERIVQRRRRSAGRRAWDLPPNLTRCIVAWAIVGPALVAALVKLSS